MDTTTRPGLEHAFGAAELLREFPLLEHGHYLNHAAISPWPRSTCEAVKAFAVANMQRGPADYGQWLHTSAQLRARVAQLIGADSAADIALLPNTTYGINLVAAGLDWRDGDNLVLPGDEFPSNDLPWAALQARGVEVRRCRLRSGDDPEAALLAHCDRRTRLLTLSSVQWIDGLRLDLDRLGAACRERGILLFVDAIQQLGALEVNVTTSQVDFLAAGGHKWQMGPEGVAVFYCRAALREQLRPLALGWRMLEEPFQFDRPDRPLAPSAARYEPGTGNTMGQLALHASLGVLERVGMRTVEARVLANTRQLRDGLAALPGTQIVSSRDPRRQSGIVSFSVAGHDSSQLCTSLHERGVSAVCRGPVLRLSPHFYQGSAVMEAVLEIVEAVVSKK